MNIALWIIQVLLALHTIAGAIWKFSNSAEKTMPSLAAIPPAIWRSLSLVEILCAIGLVAPFFLPSMSPAISIAALMIAIEMLAFCGLHLASGNGEFGPMIYWILVAIVCGLVAYGRTSVSPLS